MSQSRYGRLPIKELVDDRGRTVRYLSRRFIPSSGEVVGQCVLGSGERLDHVAARYLGDPTAYWQLCDGNKVVDPNEVERPSTVVRRLTITRGGT